MPQAGQMIKIIYEIDVSNMYYHLNSFYMTSIWAVPLEWL